MDSSLKISLEDRNIFSKEKKKKKRHERSRRIGSNGEDDKYRYLTPKAIAHLIAKSTFIEEGERPTRPRQFAPKIGYFNPH